MSADEREQRAERAVRRGELLVAIEHFESYLADHPEDERVRQRMESVRALLQPSELVSRRRAEPEETEGPAAESLSDAEQGEMHASGGRFAEAMSAYERALQQSPRNQLLRERLEELRALSGPGARADLHDAEKLEAISPSRGQPAAGARSARANDAVFGPLDEARRAADARQAGSEAFAQEDSRAEDPQAEGPDGASPQRDPVVSLLEDLLVRVRAGRRTRA